MKSYNTFSASSTFPLSPFPLSSLLTNEKKENQINNNYIYGERECGGSRRAVCQEWLLKIRLALLPWSDGL